MDIIKCESTVGNVRITLADGVTIDISPNRGFLHLSFSGIREGVTASRFAKRADCGPVLKYANYLDIEYVSSSVED
jgi:hypothetical protein